MGDTGGAGGRRYRVRILCIWVTGVGEPTEKSRERKPDREKAGSRENRIERKEQ